MKIKFSFLFLISMYQTCSERFGTFNEVNGLRTFLPLNLRTWPRYDKVSKVIYLPYGRKYLLQFCWSNRLWNNLLLKSSIFKVQLSLWYLDITTIKRLSESVCSLYSLQTLMLYYWDSLVELPTMMCKLIRLHHLGISYSGVKEMPSQMGHLLQKLSNYRAGK